MKALILAAGRSKRMKPIEDKNFLDFFGEPLLKHQLEMILDQDIKEVAIVCGAHNKSPIENLAKEFSNVSVIEQEDLDAGMCGAVLSSKDFIGNEPTLIFSSNDVVEKEAFALINQAYKSNEAESYIIGKTVKSYFPGGYLEIDEQNIIKSIIEKPEPGSEPSNLVNLVIHLHTQPQKLVEKLEQISSEHDDLYEKALMELINDGVNMKALEYNGFWQPIKFPWHIKKVFDFMIEHRQEKISQLAEISKNAIINGKVIIEDGAKVFDGAVINGPSYIGKNSVVATNALVRDSYVGNNCVIGFSTEVARSYLGSDVWTHSNYIGDSVIGNDVSFGAGAVTGNLRLDEKNIQVDFDGKKVDTESNKFGVICGNNVRVGINTSIMPGVKIGQNSFVGAGIVISQNIADNSFVRGSWELKISKNKQKADSKNREQILKNLNETFDSNS